MFTGKDAQSLASKIRELLGSRGAIGNLRVSKRAIEFDLFAEDTGELEERLKLLEKQISKRVTVKLLDKILRPMEKKESAVARPPRPLPRSSDSGRMMALDSRMSARSSTLRSSRTLPG